MDFVIQQDIQQLVFDSNNRQMAIKELIKDSKAWARELENQDMARLAVNLKRLESDVILLQVDWITLIGQSHQEYSQYSTFEDFQRAFDSLVIYRWC